MLDLAWWGTIPHYSGMFLVYSLFWALPSWIIGTIYIAQQYVSHRRKMVSLKEAIYVKDMIVMVICYPVVIIIFMFNLLCWVYKCLGGLRLAGKIGKVLDKKVWKE